jgi:hypothetical protein
LEQQAYKLKTNSYNPIQLDLVEERYLGSLSMKRKQPYYIPLHQSRESGDPKRIPLILLHIPKFGTVSSLDSAWKGNSGHSTLAERESWKLNN